MDYRKAKSKFHNFDLYTGFGFPVVAPSIARAAVPHNTYYKLKINNILYNILIF